MVCTHSSILNFITLKGISKILFYIPLDNFSYPHCYSSLPLHYAQLILNLQWHVSPFASPYSFNRASTK